MCILESTNLHDNHHIHFALLPNSTQYFIDDDTFEPPRLKRCLQGKENDDASGPLR